MATSAGPPSDDPSVTAAAAMSPTTAGVRPRSPARTTRRERIRSSHPPSTTTSANGAAKMVNVAMSAPGTPRTTYPMKVAMSSTGPGVSFPTATAAANWRSVIQPPLAAVVPLILPKLGAGVLVALSLLFFRTGLGAYGGGFAVVPTLHSAAVGGGWITERQFASAVAVGKLTPGPVLLMATFIGYVVQGLPGAVVATFTIFAAPFALVVVLGAWLLRMRSRRVVRAGLRGLTPAVVGLMAAAAVTLGASLHDPVDIAIAAATVLTLSRFHLNPALLLAVAGGVRWALAAAGL